MTNELTYWVALAHTPSIWTRRKNEMIVHCFNTNKTIVDFFESDNFLDMNLSDSEVALLNEAKGQMNNYAFMVEDLLNQGYEIIDIRSPLYPKTLKANMKYNSPLILYIKGNKELLHMSSVAIVGSRRANDISLQFTDTIAQIATTRGEVTVSGYAKGIDQQALDSTLKYMGKSIVVLPQGITTFGTGLKKLYKEIIAGNILVLSTFHPKAPWSADLAMARNTIIYALADMVYVAQSEEKGGTWSGVCNGLKNNRSIYVRLPEVNEKSANKLLIQKGAKPIDINGNTDISCDIVSVQKESKERIAELLNDGKSYKVREIKTKLNLPISEHEIREILSDTQLFEKTTKNNTSLYSKASPSLFAQR